MRNKIRVVVMVVLICFLLCACESQNIRDSRVAFLEKRYEDVIILLENEKIDDPEIMKYLHFSQAMKAYSEGMYSSVVDYLRHEDLSEEPEFEEILVLSRAYIAFENKEFQKVNELLSSIEQIDDVAIRDMQEYSIAQIAFADGRYEEVVDILGDKEQYNADPIVKDSWKVILSQYISNKELSQLIDCIEKNTIPCEIVDDLLIDNCKNYDYDAFLFLDNVIAELDECELKTDLQTFSEENVKMRTKAFLKGTWEWQQDYEEKTRVEVFVSEDDSECVGVVKNVGTSLSWYRYEVGEVYWKDFLFEEGVLVSSFNLTKLQNGDPIGSTAFYTLYFDSGTIHIQLAPKSSRHRITNSIRTWVKTTD